MKLNEYMKQSFKDSMIIEYLIPDIQNAEASIDDFMFCIVSERWKDGSNSVSVFFRDNVIHSKWFKYVGKKIDYMSDNGKLNEIIDAVRDYELDGPNDLFNVTVFKNSGKEYYHISGKHEKDFKAYINNPNVSSVEFFNDLTVDEWNEYVKNIKR